MSLKGQKRLIARAAMVSGIVTDAASLLRAIHRLDGCIQVENRILQRLHEAGDDVIVDLGQGQDARFVVEAVQSSVQRVVVRELVQAQLQAKQRVMLKLVDVYDAFASERIDRSGPQCLDTKSGLLKLQSLLSDLCIRLWMRVAYP